MKKILALILVLCLSVFSLLGCEVEAGADAEEGGGEAMEKGDLYASTGPEIKELWFEDGRIHVVCSPAATIKANYGARYAELHEASTYTSFPVPEDYLSVRITVTDTEGRCANTRAYFVDELYREE
jgi:hypothetical protein